MVGKSAQWLHFRGFFFEKREMPTEEVRAAKSRTPDIMCRLALQGADRRCWRELQVIDV